MRPSSCLALSHSHSIASLHSRTASQPSPASRPASAPRRASNTRCMAGDTASSSSTSPMMTAEPSFANIAMLAELADFLREDLPHLFDDQGIDRSRYAEKVEFRDPITSYDTISGYLFNIGMLKNVFTPKFILHDVQPTGELQLTTRWTMTMNFRVLPWNPELLFTGVSIMDVDPETGKFIRHVDKWDSIGNNEYLSTEAVQDLISQCGQLYATPDLESPEYTVLRRTANYEIREYKSFLVAETAMGSGAGVAEGPGFNVLASYIFGQNQAKESMAMTTPVFTGGDDNTMQFVIGSKYNEDSVPQPNEPSVVTKSVESRIMAALKFSGVTLDNEAQSRSSELRSYLAADKLQTKGECILARYNEPTALPFVRLNEVLVELTNFSL